MFLHNLKKRYLFIYFSTYGGEEDTIHLCSLVTTADRSDTRYIEGWTLLTKSALLRTEHKIHFHLVVDEGAKKQMLE